MRRKGERPVPKRLVVITATSPVVLSIADGDHWFNAWVSQACTPWAALARTTGIPATRFAAIKNGDKVSRAEVDALARAWSVSTADLISTIPDPTIVID